MENNREQHQGPGQEELVSWLGVMLWVTLLLLVVGGVLIIGNGSWA